MSPQCLHRVISYKFLSASRSAKTVDFPTLADTAEAVVKRSPAFLILRPWVRIPPGAFLSGQSPHEVVREATVY